MKSSTLARLAAGLLATVTLALDSSAQFSIDECGTVISQPFGGCSRLFQSDSGLVLQDSTVGTAPFNGAQVGDRLRVTGTWTNLCPTFCAIDGCLTTLTADFCLPPGVGVGYCFGSGGAVACPCGNVGSGTEGCANSGGSGAILSGVGSASVGLDNLGFSASQLLPSQPALLFSGLNAVNGGSGTVFGDGLRCAGGGVVRLGVGLPDANGSASWGGSGLAAIGGWAAGDTRHFQVWYRDPAGSPCGSGFNLSHGVAVTFTP